MATRNFVPRVDGEGKIGTAAKRWLEGRFVNLYGEGGTLDFSELEVIGNARIAGLEVTGFAKCDGVLSIGTDTTSANLNIEGSFTDPAAGTCGINILLSSKFTESQDQPIQGIYSLVRPAVATGATNNSTCYGTYSSVLRNNIAAATDDSGTLGYLMGVNLIYGHNSVNSAATPQTNYAYGIRIMPYNQAGTIANMYSLYLGTLTGSGAITNRWSIYQADSASKNYLAASLGIGTSSPTISDGVGLHIAGSILRLGTAKTPASASATGNAGEICRDANYLYICTATNTWKRVAISTW